MTPWHHPRPSLLHSLGLLLAAACLAHAAGVSRKCTARCPNKSKCSSVGGAPVCKCPGEQRLLQNKCTSASLGHSDWLDPLNSARAAVGAVPLKWSNKLAKQASAYAKKLGGTPFCRLRHSVPRGEGQTLAGGAQRINPATTNTDVTNLWVAEGAQYSFAKFDARKGGCSTGNWEDCGHYLQIIWNKTKSVGCGSARCQWGRKTGKLWVCNYKPAGNVIGEYPYSLDPCYGVRCPHTATCVSTSGEGVCKCPRGQAVVRKRCAKDPCRGHSCPGNQVCDPSSGRPRCGCQKGTVPIKRGSTVCAPPECRSVHCPAAASCAVGSRHSPMCICPKRMILQGDACTRRPSGPVVLTNVALYRSSSSVPRVLRFPKVGSCINLKSFKVNSYKIVWEAPASQSTGPIPGVTTTSCGVLSFWDREHCQGSSMNWAANQGDISKHAEGLFRRAVSLGCS